MRRLLLALFGLGLSLAAIAGVASEAGPAAEKVEPEIITMQGEVKESRQLIDQLVVVGVERARGRRVRECVLDGLAFEGGEQ